MPTIELKNIFKNYSGSHANAVDDLNLTINDGDFLCMLGPSGCGKTTTLRMIAGLEQPTGGTIKVRDRVLDSVDLGIFVPPEKRNMGLVFQSYALWPHLTIERNTDFGLRLNGTSKAEREARTTSVMKTMGIEKYRDRYPSQLSGGQQQRVALARMLAVSPQVMLLDEPLSNLDSRLRLEMRAELKRIHDQFRSTVVFVTHDQWEAMTLATRIAVMFEGKLQQLGSPTDIYDRPANRFVAEFLGNPPINIIEFSQSEKRQNPGRDVLGYLERFIDPGVLIGSAGIRPESFQLHGVPPEHSSSELHLEAEVFALLPTGGSWIIETICGSQHVFAVTSSKPTVSVGQKVTLSVDVDNVHAFDADGIRIAVRAGNYQPA